MVEPFRSDFNARFTEAKYGMLLRRLEGEAGVKIAFRVAETPCFFPLPLLNEMMVAGQAMTEQLLGSSSYLQAAEQVVPEAFQVPGRGTHPHFMTVDFGLVRDGAGELHPRLVEMQAFPSIFGFQPGFARAYKEVFELDSRLESLYGGLDEEAYWGLLRQVIVGDHRPEHVVLLEVDPENQKTRADFCMHEQRLGIRTVDIQTVEKRGGALFYRDPQNGGAWTRIERIYNRAIADEIVRRGIALPFDLREPLEVEWAGHPNWYFQISKFSLPFLQHPAVPAAAFLDDWFAGCGRDRLPRDRQQWVLKPLYSFAGKGIHFAPSDSDLQAIPAAERHNFLLQERVHFEPVIRTPEGLTQAEVRILYVWPEGGRLTPMTSLVRMGRGLMMGVDHNREQRWVGGSAGLFLPDPL